MRSVPTPSVRFLLPALTLAAASALSSPARAADDGDKARCVDANARAQDLRRDGKLAEAHDKLVFCASASCPDLIRRDCTKRLDELEGARPSVVFEVTDKAGVRRADAKITVDGKPLSGGLSGSPMTADPGTHSVTFEAAGAAPVTREFVLLEGDKAHREVLVLDTGGPTASGLGGARVAGLTLGGVGVAGMVAGGVFGGLAFSEKSKETSACNGSCTGTANASAASDARKQGVTDATISTVGLAAGGALVVGGAILFFTAHEAGPSATAAWRIVPTVTVAHGGTVGLQGAF